MLAGPTFVYMERLGIKAVQALSWRMEAMMLFLPLPAVFEILRARYVHAAPTPLSFFASVFNLPVRLLSFSSRADFRLWLTRSMLVYMVGHAFTWYACVPACLVPLLLHAAVQCSIAFRTSVLQCALSIIVDLTVCSPL